MKGLLIFAIVFVVACGEDVAPEFRALPEPQTPVELAECNQYLIWEFERTESMRTAVADACAEHQKLAGVSSVALEAKLFTTPIIFHELAGDELMRIERAGGTLRVGIAVQDPELVFLAMRKALTALEGAE